MNIDTPINTDKTNDDHYSCVGSCHAGTEVSQSN